MRRRLMIMATVLFILIGPCAYAVMTDMAPTATPTAEAAGLDMECRRPKKGDILSVDGRARGYLWNFAGRFNWRGKYKGPYMAETRVSTEHMYTLYGVDYYPAVERNGRFKGWYARDASTVRKVKWKDSEVILW